MQTDTRDGLSPAHYLNRALAALREARWALEEAIERGERPDVDPSARLSLVNAALRAEVPPCRETSGDAP